MGESEVVPVEKICRDCFYVFKGHNQICPSCGSSSVEPTHDQEEIKPSANLVFSTLPIGYGGIE